MHDTFARTLHELVQFGLFLRVQDGEHGCTVWAASGSDLVLFVNRDLLQCETVAELFSVVALLSFLDASSLCCLDRSVIFSLLVLAPSRIQST
jgi:hypothetical protein